MKQMEVPEEMKVELNFQDANVPESAKVLKPVLFREGDSYCCVLGPDPQEGVFGCGAMPEDALQDWDAHVKERMEHSVGEDQVADFIRTNFKTLT